MLVRRATFLYATRADVVLCALLLDIAFVRVKTFSINAKKLIRKSHEYADNRDIVEDDEEQRLCEMQFAFNSIRSGRVEEGNRTNFFFALKNITFTQTSFESLTFRLQLLEYSNSLGFYFALIF